MSASSRHFVAACLLLSSTGALAYAEDSPIPLGAAPNYREIVAQNRAAVVGITAEFRGNTAAARSAQQTPDDDQDDGCAQSDAAPEWQNLQGRPAPHKALPVIVQGSGFLVQSDGLLLTNAHVVKGSVRATVKLADRREFAAKVVGLDDATDIAVLRIDAHDLPVVRIGNSNALSVGDYVLAIGAPFGLEETATAGIISAMSRSLPQDAAVPFIQTDVPVNPGSSGGPLFDASGAVVGINSQIYSSSGGYQGVAFAIPINVAEQIETQIVATGKAEHGRLGVQVQSMDQKLAQSLGLVSPNGALVATVVPHSAAAAAGLKVGDVIVKFNGETIDDAGALSSRVTLFAPGHEATLVLLRDGHPMTISTKIRSDADADDARDTPVRQRASGTEQSPLGLTVRPLTRDERRETGIPGGLVVEDAQGAAADAGIQEGDVVLNVAGAQVNSVAELRALISRHAASVALLIQRGADRLFVPVDTH
ncbi:MAG TPA: Do family serine endopeptidase [Steroidobacteraceae bacterium]|jgi:serine protease Do|nr:Do family serine endopeptidase [Steroidobacteraceae bacterium]